MGLHDNFRSTSKLTIDNNMCTHCIAVFIVILILSQWTSEFCTGSLIRWIAIVIDIFVGPQQQIDNTVISPIVVSFSLTIMETF